MSYQLNRQALERLKALIRAGKFVGGAWRFSAGDSNALLDDPPNWTEFGLWFLGIKDGVPDPAMDTGVTPRKDWYAYPFGKAGVASLGALRQIIALARQQGDGAIADAAEKVLADAMSRQADKLKASGGTRLDLLAEARIEAAAAGADGQAGGPPRFSMLAYTGGTLKLPNWKYPVIVDLDGVEPVTKARPILLGHDQNKPVGHAPLGGIVVGEGKITASGLISGSGDHVQQVVQSALSGFPWQASVGMKVKENQFVPPGRSARVNGRSFQGPVNIARRSALGEISFVTLGADDDTSARIAAEAAEGSVMTFEQWLEAMGLKVGDISAEQKTKLQAKFDVEQDAIRAAADKDAAGEEEEMDDEDEEDEESESDDADQEDEKKKPVKGKGAKAKGAKAKGAKAKKDAQASAVELDLQAIRKDTAKQIRAAHVSETKRIGKIREVCASRHADIEAKAIEEGWDETRTELAVLRAERKAGGTGSVNATFGINTGAGTEITPDVIAASAALAGGVSEKAATAGLSDNQKSIAASRKLRNSVGSIYGLCSIVAAAHGVRMPSNRMDGDVLNAMSRIERRVSDLDITADGGAGGYSTMSLSGLTENILNKAMLEAYGMVESAVPDICYESDTNDFKQYKRYRLTASGILAALGAAGELKSISLQDESYPNQVKTQGVILTIGRDMLLNDDTGSLTQAPTLLGRGAALFREMQVFATYLALPTTVAPGASIGQPANAFNFFSAGASNYLSGAGSVLQISALTSAVQKFEEQTDANNMPVMLRADRLLVPPALRVTAQNLFNGANLVVGALGSTTAKSIEPNLNAHAKMYRPVVSPFLSAAVSAKIQKQLPSYPTASDTAWSLLTNPTGGFASIQIGYLRGQRVPVIERGEANFNTLGIAMRCYYDFGVAPHDYRCGVYSAGA